MKKILLTVVVASMMMLLVACSSAPKEEPTYDVVSVTHTPAVMPEVVEEPKPVEEVGPSYTLYQEDVISSWYGGRYYNGRRTASGEIYNDQLLTAAHRKLPFGTKIRVTNRENGKSVDVVVNDRGPYIKGRSLDLSKAAFAAIGDTNRGLLHVDIYVIGE